MWQSRSRAQLHAYKWLKSWMLLHGDKFFGDHGKGVGQEFLTNMLGAPPVIIAPQGPEADGSDMSFVDPVDVAAKIMAERQCVADRCVCCAGARAHACVRKHASSVCE